VPSTSGGGHNLDTVLYWNFTGETKENHKTQPRDLIIRKDLNQIPPEHGSTAPPLN
jgi:hypothetical protein